MRRRADEHDEERRRLLAGTVSAAGGLALVGASYPFLASFAPSERARGQGGPVEVDISALAPRVLATVEWRGKPVWLLRRTPEMVASLEAIRGALTDPDSQVASQQPEYARNPGRSIRPELFADVRRNPCRATACSSPACTAPPPPRHNCRVSR